MCIKRCRSSSSLNIGQGRVWTGANALEIGYGFDYIVHDQEAKQPTSHEIRIGYTLPVSPFGGKKVIRTPRFRH